MDLPKIDNKSVSSFISLYCRLGILLHPTELQMLWSSLDIAKDGLVHYAELFDYFMHRSKKHKPEKRKSSTI